MKHLTAVLVAAILLLPGCMKERIHQGNVLQLEKVNQVHEGDSKFRVETLLGMPMLKNELHPNRVSYVEDFEDKDSGKRITRGVEITYDDALRVTRIRRFGAWK